MKPILLTDVKTVPVGSPTPTRKRLALVADDLKQVRRAAIMAQKIHLNLLLQCQDCHALIKVTEGSGGVQLDCDCATREVI